MKQRIYNTLNIKASESKQVFDLLSVQFFIGLANALLNIISFTLFIYHFSVNVLPQVYLTVALVLVVLNFFYEKLEHKLSPLRLLQIVIAISVVILICSWMGLTFGVKGDFIFMLMVANTIIYMITGYAYWGLVSLLFNVRESRRVFSVVGSGDIPAKLIGYIVAPLLIPFIGLPNLLWVAILSMGISLFLFNKIIRKKSWDHIRKNHGHEGQHEVHTAKKQDIVSFFFKNKLIFAISLLSILSYNVFILIDYTFIAQVKLRFENITNLALYVSAFFAVGRVIAIIFKLIFTSRVIERLGIISSLFITPIALFLFCMLFFIYKEHSNYNVFIFGVMALLTEVLRSSMQEPVFFILFQPLKEQLRLKGHIIAKGHTLPPSLIVVGLSLLLMIKWSVAITILLTVKIILINLLIWAAVIFLIQKAYLITLHHSILKGTFSSDDQYVYDQTAIDILLNKINTGKNAEVIYSLDLLKKSGYPQLTELLHQQLHHPEAEVRKYSLEQIENGKAVLKTLRDILPGEKDAEVRQKIISILCRQDSAFLDAISNDLANQDYDTRKTIIINLLNHHEFDYLFKAGNEINSLIHSPNPEEKHLAINIITELKHVHFTTAITNLINDDEPSVKRSAIMAACKLKITSLLPMVLDLTNQSTDKYLVIKGLQQYGDKLFEDIQSLPKNVIHNYTPDFIKIASNIKGEHSKRFLLTTMNELNQQTNKTIHALWVQNYEPADEKSREAMEALLNKYLKTGISKIADHHNTPHYSKEKEIVKKSLVSEVKTDLIVSLKICSMLFRKKQISRILELIETENQHKLYNAMEMIEIELRKKISKDLISLFDFILDPAGHKPLVGKTDTTPLFSKIYFSDSFTYNPWTKAIIMYCSWKNNIKDDLKIISQKKDETEPLIITETKDFVLSAIN